jgi:hypothetical protein
LFLISSIGAFKIKPGSLIEDMPKPAFFSRHLFFEKEFEGIMPLKSPLTRKGKSGS